MNGFSLLCKSALQHRRQYVGVFAGAAIASAVIAGALIIGRSVTATLRHYALQRIGRVTHALDAGSRFTTESLASRIQAATGSDTAPVLRLDGMVSADSEGVTPAPQANRVQVLGVDRRFQALGHSPAAELEENQASVNRALAARLGLRAGDGISVRVARPDLLPGDAPLANRREDATVRGTFSVREIVSDDALGRFKLATDQAAPLTVFVPLRWLQDRCELPGKANLLLCAEAASPPPDMAAVLRGVWQPEDAGLVIAPLEGAGGLQVTCERVFFDDRLARSLTSLGGLRAFTYLANGLTSGERAIPYSFVTALAPGAGLGLPEEPAGDTIVINRWTADELAASTGAEVRLSSFSLQDTGALVETSRIFRVSAIAGMAELGAERAAVPNFPGLSDVESCADWDIGMPLDSKQLDDKRNEAYWKSFRQTPKAFIALQAGESMWSNRFGGCTAIRFRNAGTDVGAFRRRLASELDPAAAGLVFTHVRRVALDALQKASYFGGLFLGMSFFILFAALILMALLHAFSLEQRAGQAGILLSLGFRARALARLALAEGLLVTLAGTAGGLPLSVLYARALVAGLSAHWQPAVAGTPLMLAVAARDLATAAAATVVASLLVLHFSSRALLRRAPVDLLMRDATQERERGAAASRRQVAIKAGAASILAALALAVVFLAQRDTEQALGTFFGAGFALLLAGMLAYTAWLQALASPRRQAAPSLSGIAWRNSARRRRRSVAVSAMLAGGCFLLFSTASMQLDPRLHAGDAHSGTGGYSFFAESSAPLAANLRGGLTGRKSESSRALPPPETVPFKLHEGDHAGCLNLNKAAAPRILGADTGRLKAAAAFTGDRHRELWDLLVKPLPDGAIPALVADTDTLQWGLEKRASPDRGDELLIADESGQPVRLRLVGVLPHRQTVFHGSLLIAQESFSSLFPSDSGYRVFLIKTPGAVEAPVNAWVASLDRYGLDAVRTTDRLLQFHAVEGSYLAMFLALGGIGLLIGTAGIGVIVLRNGMERRRELAMLMAVGYRRSRLFRLLAVEQAGPSAVGFVTGTCAAAVAMTPSIATSSTLVPWTSVLALAGAMAFTVTLAVVLCVAAVVAGLSLRALDEE